MRVKATINYEGKAVPLREFDLAPLQGATADALQKYFEDKARQLVQTARGLLKFRILYPDKSTGRAERSIGWRSTSNGITFYIGAPYGGYIEEGTRYIVPKHFMSDAITLVLADNAVDTDLDTVLHNVVNKVVMKS